MAAAAKASAAPCPSPISRGFRTRIHPPSARRRATTLTLVNASLRANAASSVTRVGVEDKGQRRDGGTAKRLKVEQGHDHVSNSHPEEPCHPRQRKPPAATRQAEKDPEKNGGHEEPPGQQRQQSHPGSIGRFPQDREGAEAARGEDDQAVPAPAGRSSGASRRSRERR